MEVATIVRPNILALDSKHIAPHNKAWFIFSIEQQNQPRPHANSGFLHSLAYAAQSLTLRGERCRAIYPLTYAEERGVKYR